MTSKGLEVRLLGPVQATVDGRPVPLSAAKQRAVLAMLALDVGRVVSSDALIAGAWGDEAPASLDTLKSVVSRLRRALSDAGAATVRIVGAAPGYVLDADSQCVDCQRFASLVAQARRAMAGDEPAVAAGVLDEALSLWRGPALADMADLSFARAQAARLHETRLAAVEDLAEAELALGRWHAVVSRLEPHVSSNPFRERAWGQLMVALYRSGRQAEALRAYQDVRRILGEELGLEPNPELRRLEREIVLQRLGAASDAAVDVAVVPAVRTNLPLLLSRFSGRRAEQDRLTELLATSRLVTLTGPGGVGKTRLAIEVARSLTPSFPDGVFFVDLAAVTRPDLIAAVLAAVVELPGANRQGSREGLVEHLAVFLGRRPALVVFDNCEHVLAAVAALSDGLLSRSPTLRVLATSRERLGAAGETEWGVPPLTLPSDRASTPAELAGSDAVRLFCERAGALGEEFVVTEDNASAVARICRRLGGIPLALELSAVRVGPLGASALAERLDQRLGVGGGEGPAEAPAADGTLAACLDWSHEFLSEGERVVLRRLSVFAGSFDPESADTVAGHPASRSEVLGILARLVDTSWVGVESGTDGTRFRLTGSVRCYAAGRLAAAGEQDLIAARHRNQSLLAASGYLGAPLRAVGTEAFLQLALPLARAVGELHDADLGHEPEPSGVGLLDASPTAQTIDVRIATRLPRLHRATKASDRLARTLAYLSPEELTYLCAEPAQPTNAAVDHRSDFYSLGATFYEMLTGQAALPAGDAMELVRCHLTVRPPAPADVNPAVPRALSDIVAKLLAKAPEHRYQSAHGLVRDLEACRAQWARTGRIEPFPLGRHDDTGRLRLPERLYGRHTEVGVLIRSLEQAAAGAARVVLLTGPSGTGKTALARVLDAPTRQRGGYFISGKFDQYSGGVPYGSLIDAFRDLVRQLLDETPDRIAAWRRRIIDALGANTGVVAEVIPDVKRITGDVPDVADLGATEARNRFNLVFRQFTGVFSRPDQPLVVFLDDLHWADVDSLRLLDILLGDSDAEHLLVVGAFRPETVAADGPLWGVVNGFDPTRVDRLELGALALDAVTQLVADTLGASPPDAAALAGLVQERTGGNPFFVGQFLLSLHQDGLIRFAPGSGRWLWSLTAIRRRGVTDNVLDLMASRVGELPAATQEALRIAAVIGNTFDLATLAGATATGVAEQAAAGLNPAIRRGLVIPLGSAHGHVMEGRQPSDEGEVSYRFLHDRVQQACFSGIPAADVAAIHQRIGNLLLDRLRRRGRDEDVFEVVAHLNAGVAATPADDPGRRRLVQLNLEAARKAKAQNAYEAALTYLDAGVSLLPAPAWDDEYDLTFAVRLLRAQVLAVVGQVDEAEPEFVALLSRARTGIDRAECCAVRSEALHSTGRPVEAYAAGLAGLHELGIHFPTTAEEAAAETQALLSRLVDPSVLGRLGRLGVGDEEALLAGRLFWRAIVGAYWSQPTDLPLVVGTNIEHVLRTGLAPHVCVALGMLGMVVLRQGHSEMAMAYGDAALSLAERFDDPFIKGRATLVAWCMTLAWKHPFEVSEQALHENARLCFSTGDLEFVNHSLIAAYFSALMAGRDCPTILDRCERWLDYCLSFAPLEAGQARIRSAALRRLMGAEPRAGDSDVVDPEAVIGKYEEDGDLTDACESLMELARLAVLFGDYEAAYAHSARAEPAVDAGAAGTLVVTYLFRVNYAIAAARLAATAEGEQRAAYLATAERFLDMLRPFAESHPENFGSYFSLAAAERARAVGDRDEATVLYLRTIEHAGRHGYLLVEGFANELLARLYRERGLRFAVAHLHEARALYHQCGAAGKAAALEEEFPELRQS